MEIGTEKPSIVIEPAEDPVPREAPSPAPEVAPAREREPDLILA